MDHSLTDADHHELATWRVAHPQATFAELEAVVEERVRASACRDARPAACHCGRATIGGDRCRSRPLSGVWGGDASAGEAHAPCDGGRRSFSPLTRAYAVCPVCGTGLSPLDEQLALLPGQFAPRVVEGIVRLGVWMPFERVPEVLAFFTGVTVSVETVRRLTEQAGAAQVAVETARWRRWKHGSPLP